MRKDNILFIIFTIVLTLLVVILYLYHSFFNNLQPVPQPDTTITPTPEEAFMHREENSLVEGFPEFPVYPDADIAYSYVKGKQLVGYEAEWIVDDSVTDVVIWYIDTLRALGWLVEDSPTDLPTREFFFIAHKDNLSAYITIEIREDETTEIIVEFPVRQI